MTAPRSRLWLICGLTLVMAGLFAAVFALNYRQHKTALMNTDTALMRMLEQQKELCLQHISQAESALFALHETGRVLEADLFLLLDNGIIPACIASITPAIGEQEAAVSFRSGIGLLPSGNAVPHFKTAAQGPEDTAEAVYRKAAALFNLLEFDRNPQTVCSILALLERGEELLTDTQRMFFRSMLEEQIPDLEWFEQRLNALQESASLMASRTDLSDRPCRMVVDNRLLSMREDGLAALFTPELPTPEVVEFTTVPTGTYREIIPGLYAVASADAVAVEKRYIHRQYRSGNLLLLFMAVLGGALLATLLAAERRQQKLEAMRTRFIATVSHELRTPLSLIRLHAETLHHGRIPDEKTADYHRIILTESERLTGIVNNVLDFSRIERGKLQLHPETVDLSECTHRVIDAFGYRLEEENFELIRKIDPGITAEADPLAWSQILFNLLDNALKYSDDIKQISVTLDSTGKGCELQVADRGIGVPDKIKKAIFEDYVRAGDSRVTARRGSGIGLSVAKQLIERMNGSIRIGDNEPKGSVFTVNLNNINETADC